MLKKILLWIWLLTFFTISYFSIKSWRFTNHTKTMIDNIKVNNILQQETINKDKNQEDIQQSTITQWCKEQSSQEYLTNKICLEKIKSKNFTGVNIYNAIDECFSYRDTIDYSSKNICYDTYKRNDVLYSICVESVRKDNAFDSLWDPLVMLQFRINMAECMSKIVFRDEEFTDLSAEMGNKSSFKKCSNISQCWEQEFCNVNQSSHCEKSKEHIYSIEEIEWIIKENEFTDQWCAHSGLCSITSSDKKWYFYKITISWKVDEILKKYNKTITNQRIE